MKKLLLCVSLVMWGVISCQAGPKPEVGTTVRALSAPLPPVNDYSTRTTLPSGGYTHLVVALCSGPDSSGTSRRRSWMPPAAPWCPCCAAEIRRSPRASCASATASACQSPCTRRPSSCSRRISLPPRAPGGSPCPSTACSFPRAPRTATRRTRRQKETRPVTRRPEFGGPLWQPVSQDRAGAAPGEPRTAASRAPVAVSAGSALERASSPGRESGTQREKSRE